MSPRTLSASSPEGIGYGKTRSSWISPSASALAKLETVVVAMAGILPHRQFSALRRVGYGMPTSGRSCSRPLLAAAARPASASAVVGGQDASRPYPHMAARRRHRRRVGSSAAAASSRPTESSPPRTASTRREARETSAGASSLHVLHRHAGSSTTAPRREIVADERRGHEDYERRRRSYDVALVDARAPATKGTPIRIAAPAPRSALWAPGEDGDRHRLGLAGLRRPGLTLTTRSRRSTSRCVSDDDCDDVLPRTSGRHRRETMVCAGELHGHARTAATATPAAR